MRKYKHAIFLGLLALLFFSDGETEMGIFLSVVGALLFLKWRNSPLTKIRSKINKDAKIFNIRIPSHLGVRSELENIYSKYFNLTTNYPALKETYEELIFNLWQKLSLLNRPNDWVRVIGETSNRWPDPRAQISLEKTLDKVQKETELFYRAKSKLNR